MKMFLYQITSKVMGDSLEILAFATQPITNSRGPGVKPFSGPTDFVIQ
jgi:hypothetical protein